MDECRLTDLLRHADEFRATPEPAADAIRKAARRRILRRRVAATSLAAAIVVATVAVILLPNRQPLDTPHESVAAGTSGDSPEILDLRTRIQLEAQARLDHRRVETWLAEVRPVDPAEARADAARTMVLLAPRRAAIAGSQEAAALYHRTIDLFPETPAATLARQALAKLQ